MTFDVEKYIRDLHRFLADHPGVLEPCYEAVRKWEGFICFVASKARRDAFHEAMNRNKKTSDN